MSRFSPDDIDALLPQIQCGLCGYGGCMPYAEAIVYEHAEINLCSPGGIKTLRSLGDLVSKNVADFESEMAVKTKSPTRAFIREDECIGCTKCIQVCPVDAILGAAKQMHTVLSDECSGCELCLPVCPVDCIDLFPTQDLTHKKNQFRQRYQQRQARLSKNLTSKKQVATSEKKKKYIADAIARVKARKG